MSRLVLPYLLHQCSHTAAYRIFSLCSWVIGNILRQIKVSCAGDAWLHTAGPGAVSISCYSSGSDAQLMEAVRVGISKTP